MRLTESTASEISGMVNAREVSVAEVVEDVLARIEEVDQWVQASCAHWTRRVHDVSLSGFRTVPRPAKFYRLLGFQLR